MVSPTRPSPLGLCFCMMEPLSIPRKEKPLPHNLSTAFIASRLWHVSDALFSWGRFANDPFRKSTTVSRITPRLTYLLPPHPTAGPTAFHAHSSREISRWNACVVQLYRLSSGDGRSVCDLDWVQAPTNHLHSQCLTCPAVIWVQKPVEAARDIKAVSMLVRRRWEESSIRRAGRVLSNPDDNPFVVPAGFDQASFKTF